MNTLRELDKNDYEKEKKWQNVFDGYTCTGKIENNCPRVHVYKQVANAFPWFSKS